MGLNLLGDLTTHSPSSYTETDTYLSQQKRYQKAEEPFRPPLSFPPYPFRLGLFIVLTNLVTMFQTLILSFWLHTIQYSSFHFISFLAL